MNNSEKPVARKNSLVVQELNNEVLVYDLKTNKAHCLNESAAIVWKHCDGKNTISEIAEQFISQAGNKVDDNFIWLAIDQLNELDLLEQNMKPDFKGQTRREVIKKIGLASVVALPIIASLVAPQSALASVSCTVSACTVPGANSTQCPAACSTCPPGATPAAPLTCVV
jgi:hypothetical protein